MKKILIAIFVMLCLSVEMRAQYMRPAGVRGNSAAYACLDRTAFNCIPDGNSVDNESLAKALRQKKIGTDLLITAGVSTAVGVVLFGVSFTMISDSGPYAGAFSIPGVALMGISVPLYVAGSVLYVKGKKATLQVAPGTVALRF